MFNVGNTNLMYCSQQESACEGGIWLDGSREKRKDCKIDLRVDLDL